MSHWTSPSIAVSVNARWPSKSTLYACPLVTTHDAFPSAPVNFSFGVGRTIPLGPITETRSPDSGVSLIWPTISTVSDDSGGVGCGVGGGVGVGEIGDFPHPASRNARMSSLARMRRLRFGRLPFSRAAAAFAALLTLPPRRPSATAAGFFFMGASLAKRLASCQLVRNV